MTGTANVVLWPVIGSAADIGWSRSVMSQVRTVRSVLPATAAQRLAAKAAGENSRRT
jgi:hypothetical protein